MLLFSLYCIIVKKDSSLDMIKIPECCSNLGTLNIFTGASFGESYLPVLVNGRLGRISSHSLS